MALLYPILSILLSLFDADMLCNSTVMQGCQFDLEVFLPCSLGIYCQVSNEINRLVIAHYLIIFHMSLLIHKDNKGDWVEFFSP